MTATRRASGVFKIGREARVSVHRRANSDNVAVLDRKCILEPEISQVDERALESHSARAINGETT
jgi:hypothetical protein